MEITPEVAEKWLKDNRRLQRGISPESAAMIARAIEGDAWLFNGATIVFDSDNQLCDGQHRLSAIVRAGRPALSLVVWGVEPAAFDTMDIGRGHRTAQHVLGAHGIAYASSLGGAIQVLYRLDRGLQPTHRGKYTERIKISPVDVLQYLKERPDLREAPYRAQPVFRRMHNTSVPTACAYLFARIDKVACTAFFDALATGAGLDRGSPILELRERGSEGRMDNGQLFFLFASAWNAWREGRKVRRGEWRYSLDNPVVMPQ